MLHLVNEPGQSKRIPGVFSGSVMGNMYKSKSNAARAKWICLLIAPVILLGSYILSIVWRCSLAEQRLYGRSTLIPLASQKPAENEMGTATSFYDPTYSFSQAGTTVHVHKPLINSFQHAYGSALASYEIGRLAADLLFRANEYVEAIVCSGSGSLYFYLDSKKDLFNNAAGREIGQRARVLGLNGAEADHFLVNKVLDGLAKGQILNHWRDDRIVGLPTFEGYGCPIILDVMLIRTKKDEKALKQLEHRQ